VEATEEAINQMAAKDMTFALTSKEGVEKAMLDIEAMNKRTSVTATELNRIAEEVGQSVNQAIMSLQFQDMVTQLLGHVTGRIDVMSDVLGNGQTILAMGSGDPDAAKRLLEDLCQHIDQLAKRLGDFKRNANANPVQQASYASGAVELF